MSSEATSKIESIVKEYLQAVASGQPVDSVALLAAHPELAQELAAILNDPIRLARLAADIPLRPISSDSATLPFVPAKNVEAAVKIGTSAYSPTAGPPPDSSSIGDPLIGTKIGRYRLLRKLGEGGMGSVYLAEQSEPVSRQVALKLIRSGVDSRTIIARFEAERQALAVMDHPNIARVYDGGTTAAQEPFFVMELVHGVPITDYCDQHRFSPKQRLELFVPICHAVQHAHQKGIIHRDLKPSNVLVTEVDGAPVPKVIDFGLAKATERPLTQQSLGDTGVIVGTPTYMSPEQAAPDSTDIDTRTDIYALGVMLYELLTGSTPIDTKHFQRGALLEMLRMVREVDPPRPSTKLSTAEALPSIAANRNIEPKQLQAMLRGDLDWVVMKALEKDRTRRYATANGFASDIQRYLTGEPVLAHPPSRSYWLKKFVRRNRGPVIAASLVLLVLMGGIVGTSWGMWQAEQAAAAEKAANEQTLKRLAQIEKGVELFAGMLSGINPRAEEKGGPPVFDQLRELAEKAADQLDAEAIGDQLAVARLQTILGNSLRELGNARKGAEILEKAGQTYRRERGYDHPDTLTTLNTLGVAYQAAGKVPEAIALLEQIRDFQVKAPGANHSFMLNTLSNLAAAYQAAGKLPEAIALYEQVRDDFVKTLGADHPNTLNTLKQMAVAYQATGKLAEAVRLFEQVRDSQIKTLGADHPDTLNTLSNLARAYQAAGKWQQSISPLEQIRDSQVKKLGPDHPETLYTLSYLATAYQAARKLPEAIALFEHVRDGFVKKRGTEHPDTLAALNNLALAYQYSGKLPEAIAQYEQIRDSQVKKLGPDHPDTLTTLNNLAGAYADARKLPEAIALFEQIRDARVKKLGTDHPDTLTTLTGLAYAYRAAGKLPDAIAVYEQAAMGVAKRRFEHEHARRIIGDTIATYEQTEQHDKAEAWRRQWLTVVEQQVGTDSPAYASELFGLGCNLLRQKKWVEAEATLDQCLTIRRKKEPDVWTTFNTQSALGGAFLAQKKYVEAEPLLLKGYQEMKQREKTIPLRYLFHVSEALDRLIQLYTQISKPDELKKWQAEKTEFEAKQKPQEPGKKP